MDPLLAGADLTGRFRSVLGLCKVAAGETVLIFTDPGFRHYYYAPAALAAAGSLGAKPYLMVAQSDLGLDDRLCASAWAHADVILGMTFLPGGHSWMYTDMHNAALAAGARVLMIQEPVDGLKRMFPDEAIKRRGLAGAKVLQEANKIHVVSDNGTDLLCRKDGRKGSYQSGVADIPGRWDHWPSGMVSCAPLEDSAEGVFVISPGDVLLGMWRFASTEVRLVFQNGLVTRLEGGQDAALVEAYLRKAGDDDAFRLSHLGWGTDPRADWGHIGMDSESLYGAVTLALGRNIFDAPAPYCGLGGSNRSAIHFDICCRNMSMYLDAAPVLYRGGFPSPDLT